ncbi:MAG: hypothetical protein IPJ85_07920 [Flavobacteriales bacterium]|nr:hypothetical protein [Flavobacteriales bacterium]
MDSMRLPLDWAFRPALDLELKQYILLAYLQRVRARFGEQKLYPHLDELKAHLLELDRMRAEKEKWSRELGNRLLGFNRATGAAMHEPVPQDGWLDLVDEVIDWSVPGLQRALMHGMQLREEVARRITFMPVGLLPLDPSNGWLLLRSGSDARAYAYWLSPIQAPVDQLQAARLRTRYIASYSVNLACTYDWIKSDLVRTHRIMPNPAVFAFETEKGIPCIETFLPLAKHLIYEQVAKGA